MASCLSALALLAAAAAFSPTPAHRATGRGVAPNPPNPSLLTLLSATPTLPSVPAPTANKSDLLLPDASSLGLAGRWESMGGNFVLRPPNGAAPIGVIHFLGGAFVGAAPHITYRYLLGSLADANYLVVATPFRLDMDFVRTCDVILSKFDRIGSSLAAEYGPLPVVGLGHSAGALLQTLITCLYPGAPRAANILISFNNKPAASAIPAFQELVVPVAARLMDEERRGFRDDVVGLKQAVDSAVDAFAASALAPAFIRRELLPFVRQGLEVVEQLPYLLKVIADGKQEFEPSPQDTREVCRRMYRARRTLLIKFSDDSIDESAEIEKVLREANTIMRMRRPMVEMEVLLREMSGSHITPLTQNLAVDPPSSLPLPPFLVDNPLRRGFRSNFLRTVDEVVEEILGFLDLSV